MKERKEISELKAYLEDGKNENVVIYARENLSSSDGIIGRELSW